MKLPGYLRMQFYGHFMHAEGLDRLRKLNLLFIDLHIALLLVGSCDFLAGYGAECLSTLTSLDRQGYGFFFQQSRLLFCGVKLLLRNLFVSRFLEFQIVHVSAGRFQAELFFQNKVLCVSIGYLYNLSLFAKCFDIFQ